MSFRAPSPKWSFKWRLGRVAGPQALKPQPGPTAMEAPCGPQTQPGAPVPEAPLALHTQDGGPQVPEAPLRSHRARPGRSASTVWSTDSAPPTVHPTSSFHSQLFPHVLPEAGKGEWTALFRGFSASEGLPPRAYEAVYGPPWGRCSQEQKKITFNVGLCQVDQPRQLLKSRDITLSTKVHLGKAVFFAVVMYGCESWTIKKAERQRIDAFELWCWRRFFRVSWTARRSNQSILKEISPGCSLEGLMLKLKLQYFGHLMGRADSLEKTGKDFSRCWERLTEKAMAPHSSTLAWKIPCTEEPGGLQSMGSQKGRT